ncbi:hypothetical protein [Streptomyces sp. NPDC017673]|uniref:hypothetical protein n=1 Tax=unclassified Streptomyces TaxID=2593676 RepID=UPI0037AEC979
MGAPALPSSAAPAAGPGARAVLITPPGRAVLDEDAARPGHLRRRPPGGKGPDDTAHRRIAGDPAAVPQARRVVRRRSCA